MNKTMRGIAVLLATWLALGPETAWAHLRDYLLSQPYYTASQGEFEVELWNDVNFRDLDDDGTTSSKHQIELEYGLTSHWQWAYYEVFTWDRTDDFERDELKIETKVRFSEAGELPVDVALYAEYKNPDGRQAARSDELEGKLILSKDFGPWNGIANLIAERKIGRHDHWELAYTLGASYGLSPQTRIGLELKETLGDTDEFGVHQKGHKVQLAPGIYHSFTPHIRLLIGPAIGLTRASDDLQIRSLLEVEF